MLSESDYVCAFCGETIVIPVDPSAGEVQEYIEDCPVCCSPNVLRIVGDGSGEYRVEARAEA